MLSDDGQHHFAAPPTALPAGPQRHRLHPGQPESRKHVVWWALSGHSPSLSGTGANPALVHHHVGLELLGPGHDAALQVNRVGEARFLDHRQCFC